MGYEAQKRWPTLPRGVAFQYNHITCIVTWLLFIYWCQSLTSILNKVLSFVLIDQVQALAVVALTSPTPLICDLLEPDDNCPHAQSDLQNLYEQRSQIVVTESGRKYLFQKLMTSFRNILSSLFSHFQLITHQIPLVKMH